MSVVIHTNFNLENQRACAAWLQEGFMKHGLEAEVTCRLLLCHDGLPDGRNDGEQAARRQVEDGQRRPRTRRPLYSRLL